MDQKDTVKRCSWAKGEMMIRYALGEDISSYNTALLDDTAFFRPAVNLAVLLQPGAYQRSTLAMQMEELCTEQRSEKYGKEL